MSPSALVGTSLLGAAFADSEAIAISQSIGQQIRENPRNVPPSSSRSQTWFAHQKKLGLMLQLKSLEKNENSGPHAALKRWKF
jgi:hypothetical protein